MPTHAFTIRKLADAAIASAMQDLAGRCERRAGDDACPIITALAGAESHRAEVCDRRQAAPVHG